MYTSGKGRREMYGSKNIQVKPPTSDRVKGEANSPQALADNLYNLWKCIPFSFSAIALL